MQTFPYRKLVVYNHAKTLTKSVYEITQTFPDEERYALSNQLRRAAVSICSNIAEGAGRISIKEQTHFYEMAFGSLNEVMCQLEIANELGYITQEQLNEIESEYSNISRMLSGLHKTMSART